MQAEPCRSCRWKPVAHPLLPESLMLQQSLFEENQAPQRVELIPDLISEVEEKKYLALFQEIQWQQVRMHGVIAKRRVAHYGLDYTYMKRSVEETRPAPSWMAELTERAAKLIGRSSQDLREILVTHYPAGAGIGWHKDAEVFGDAVVGISFLSDCVMKFKNPDTSEVFKFHIPRRSGYIFADEARWKWLHSISSHSEDRYSVTFRTLKSSNPSSSSVFNDKK